MKLIDFIKLLPLDLMIYLFKLDTKEGFACDKYVRVGNIPFELLNEKIRKIKPRATTFEVELLNEEIERNGDYAE